MTDTATEPRQPLPVASTRHGILLLIASVMPTMAIISLVPVLPLLMGEFSSVPGSQFIVPMALTIPALCVALFAPLVGWLADRTGRKNLLVGALFLYAAVGTLPLFLTDLYHILIARVGLGIAEAAIMTVATTMLGDYFEGEKRKRWISAQIAVVSLSAIFLIAIGGLLGELFGSRGPFLLYLVAFPIAIAAKFILFEPAVTAGAVPLPQRHADSGNHIGRGPALLYGNCTARSNNGADGCHITCHDRRCRRGRQHWRSRRQSDIP